ncbi:MAG: C-GCAxxG-C-C family protein [Eubacteriaceae bacterium]|nr:C-GCAxxG-C-C family protein [Eubacteriaceae bacterium]
MDLENSVYAEKAQKLFLEGYNCAQSVLLAFEDLYDLDRSSLLRLSSSFGGGMGRMREVCGAVSGMLMAAGLLYGYDTPEKGDAKMEHYRRVQELAGAFREENGSIVCRELLGLGKGVDDPQPAERNEEFYARRPCRELTAMAAAIMEEYINNNEIKNSRKGV